LKLENKILATRIILVRHGESSYNVERRIQGHCDESALTEAGRQMAQQAGLALSGIKFDAIYSSPLQRARETAEIIAATLTHPAPALQMRDRLKEINLLFWEAMPFEDVKEKFPESYEHWQSAPHQLRMQGTLPDGQVVDFYPVLDLFEQAREFWRGILPHHEGQTVLVVAHSGVNRALISSAIGIQPDRYQAVQQSNCGISVMNFAGGLGSRVQLESLNLTAHLGAKFPALKPDLQGPRMLLVRHGETDWNREKRFQGWVDVPLNEMGRQQAQQAAEFLRSVTIDRAVSSPMLRPKETAEIVLSHHPALTLELFPDLREISHGLWEGKLESEIESQFSGQLQQWQEAPATVQMPEGENLQQVWERAIGCWRDIVASSGQQTVLVVAHDAINKAILCHVLGLSPENFWNFRQGNGAVSVIDYPKGADGLPVLQSMNITTHLAGGVLDQTAAGAL